METQSAPGRSASIRVAADRLAEILDIAEDAIITVTLHREIVLFNRGATKIFGYAPTDILGQPLEVLLPLAYRAAHPAQVAGFAHGPEVSRVMGQRSVVVGRRKDGSEFPAEVTISKLERGGETLLTAIVRDATARKRYEDAILLMNQELEERVRIRTAELAERNLQLAQKNEENEMFVYSVSHDLRSPLVNLEGFSDELRLAISSLSQTLADARIPEVAKVKVGELIEGDGGMAESIKFIRAAVARLSQIIDALLRLSRAGRVVYHPQRVEVATIVERVAHALHATIRERQAELTIGNLPPAWADPAALEQIFANLIGNALNYLDATRAGNVEVGSLDHRSAGDGNPELGTRTYYVKDNGVGIPSAYLPKLFQALQRLHPDKVPGEGIGLAIVRRALERLGGRIWVESVQGEGSIFFFTLPPASNS